MLDLVQVGAKICGLRKVRGLTQDDIAEHLYVSRQAVSRWEQGLAAPTLDNLVELSKLLQVSIPEILCLHDPVTIDPENIFYGHNRTYIVRKICDGTLGIPTSEIFYQLSDDERMQVLQSMKRSGTPVDHDLLVKLTRNEQQMLTRGGWNICL